MQDEFYSIAFRKKIYTSLEELQADLDAWLVTYNEQRPHSGLSFPRESGRSVS